MCVEAFGLAWMYIICVFVCHQTVCIPWLQCLLSQSQGFDLCPGLSARPHNEHVSGAFV